VTIEIYYLFILFIF